MAGLSPRTSGIQRQVLNLYRDALRKAYSLPAASGQQAALTFIRQEFRAGQSVDRLDFQRIEHLLRAGKKKLDVLSRSQAFSLSK